MHDLGETEQNISLDGASLHEVMENFLLQLILRFAKVYDFQKKLPAIPSHFLWLMAVLLQSWLPLL